MREPAARPSGRWVDVPSSPVILFTVDTTSAIQIESFDPTKGTQQTLVEHGTFPMIAGGTLIFFRGSQLLAAPLQAGGGGLSGTPVLMQEDVAVNSGLWAEAAVSNVGSMAYVTTATANHVVIVSRRGAEEAEIETPGGALQPRMSPEGRRVVVAIDGNLWVYDLARKTLRPVTRDTRALFPLWAPDGRRLYFNGPDGVRWVESGCRRCRDPPLQSRRGFPELDLARRAHAGDQPIQLGHVDGRVLRESAGRAHPASGHPDSGLRRGRAVFA
jgi:hypothetical protein